MNRRRISLAITILVTLAVYSIGTGDYFIFDSHPHLAKNTELPPEPPTAPSFWNAVFDFKNSPLGRPVAMLTFAVETTLAGAVSATGMRWTNIAIHLLNGILVFFLFRRITSLFDKKAPDHAYRSQYLALLAAALWLLNPLQVSTVLYVVQRMTLLAATFTLAGLLAYLHYREKTLARGGTVSLIFAVFIFGGLAVLSKENGISLLLLVALLEWFRPETVNDKTAPMPFDAALKRVSIVALCFVPLSILLAPILFPGFFDQWYQWRDFDVWARLQTQARVLWDYVLWFVVPLPKWLGLHHDDIPVSTGLWTPWTTLPAILAWLGVIAASIKLRRRHPLATFAVLFFLLGHSLESSIIPLEMIFEHRNYLPSVGIALFTALALMRIIKNLQRPGWLITGGVIIVFVFALTVRTSYWHSEKMLAFTHYRHHPDSARSLYHFANETLTRGEQTPDPAGSALLLKAYGLYKKLSEEHPDFLVAPITLLYVDTRYFGGTESSHWIEQIQQTIQKWPMTASDRNGLNMLARCPESGWCETFEEQIADLLHTLQYRHPENTTFNRLLSRFYLLKGAPEKALQEAQNALASADSSDIRLLAAAAAAQTGDKEQAVEHLITLQREDRWGHHNKTLKRIFAYDRFGF